MVIAGRVDVGENTACSRSVMKGLMCPPTSCVPRVGRVKSREGGRRLGR